MLHSTQPYIELTEETVFYAPAKGYPVIYPAYFTKEFSELIGIIISVGRLTRSSAEINFADCWIYPAIPKRVIEIYENHWVKRTIRKNAHQQPRICGKKYVAFISYICGGDEYLEPSNEKVPAFIKLPDQEPEVIQGFLRGVLAASPKIKRNDGTYWILMRNLKFTKDIHKLIKQYLTSQPIRQKTFLVFSPTELEKFKTELDLHDPDWWTCAAEWYFRKKTFNQEKKDGYYARRRSQSERQQLRDRNSQTTE
jgi:hypothetical protein